MKRSVIVTLMVGVLSAVPAAAQLGSLIGNADKIKKGAKVARATTQETTEAEEISMGRVVAARVLATYPLSSNEKLNRYVNLVGQTVAQYSSRPQLDWHFAVINADLVNAFSTPGGYIFITTAALKQMGSEAELAGVLGHEIAHATQKHILKEIKRANVISAGTELVQSQVGSGGITDVIAKKIGDIAIDKLFKTGIGRKEELEADVVGAQMAAAAGYRDDALITFLEKLSAMAGAKSNALRQLASTHPKSEDRIKNIRQKAPPKNTGQLLAERWSQQAGM